MWRRLESVRLALPYLAAAAAAFHYIQGIVGEMITVRPEIVDFGVYFAAARHVAAGHSIYPVYSGCCFSGAAMDGYTYPPVLAVVLWPLTGLSVGVAGRVFLGVSQLCLVAALFVMHRTVRTMLPLRTQAWLLAVVLLFQPINAGNFGLQVSNILLLLFAIAAWAYVHERGGPLAGMAIGLGAALKVAPGQMLAALLTDGRRRAVMSACGFLVAAVVPLLLVWPIVGETPSYFTQVLPRFAGGVSLPYNRSLAGVVLRTYTSTGRTPPELLATVFHALQLGGVVVTWLICRRSVSTPAGRAAAFAAYLAVMPITQTVTWDHHQASDALAFVLIAPFLHANTRTWWAAVCAMVLMSVNQLQLNNMVQGAGFDPPHGAGVVVFVAAASVNLVGMFLLYGAALRVSWHHRELTTRPARPPMRSTGRRRELRIGVAPPAAARSG
jgi:glycosyl transferase family 87